MKKFVLAVCCALLCLLAGCGGEAESVEPAPEPVLEASPIPARMREEPLPGQAAALVKLADGDELLDWRAGDLNGDGVEDMALMVERSEGESEEHWSSKPRELMLLMGYSEGYARGQLSRKVVRWSGEGGMNPEPYDGMTIDETGLTVRECGKDWSTDLIFTWQEKGLSLTGYVHRYWEWIVSETSEECRGLEDRFDLLTGAFTRVGQRGETDVLLLQTTLDLPGPWLLEEAPDTWTLEEALLLDAIPPLPQREHVPYRAKDHDVTAVLNHTPQEVLDRIRETRYPGLERVDLPWTEETRANYAAFVGYPVPECYYADGEKRLYYFWLESRRSDGDVLFLTHGVWYADGDETELISINDEEELP